MPTPTPSRRAGAVLAGEWIKLRSLRSLPATLLAAAVTSVTLAVLVCTSYQVRWDRFTEARRAGFNPVDTSLGNLYIVMLFFGALGALVVTSEYGNGLIRTTFAATPQRGLVLAAKAVLFGATALAASTAICLTAFLAGQSRLGGPVPHAGLGAHGALRAVLGGALYLTLTGLFGLFLGVLARSTAIALSAVFGLFLVLPTMVNSLPKGFLWQHTVPYLPSNLGAAMWHSPQEFMVRPATAAALLAGYVLVLGAGSLLLLRRRDT